MEDALYGMPALRQFAQLSSVESIPDETTILKSRSSV
jgi:IS5 family transposase